MENLLCYIFPSKVTLHKLATTSIMRLWRAWSVVTTLPRTLQKWIYPIGHGNSSKWSLSKLLAFALVLSLYHHRRYKDVLHNKERGPQKQIETTRTEDSHLHLAAHSTFTRLAEPATAAQPTFFLVDTFYYSTFWRWAYSDTAEDSERIFFGWLFLYFAY